MTDTIEPIIEPLVHDLVEWVAKEPRQYRDMLDAWRTSCPRLMVWESASDRGFIERKLLEGRGSYVIATEAGRKFVRSYVRP
jgi:hypothetical protein